MYISMGCCKKDATPLLTHRSYVFLALTHRYIFLILPSLQWRHYNRDGISNKRRLDCSLNRLFQAQIIGNIKSHRQWPLWGDFPNKEPVTRGVHLMLCGHHLRYKKRGPKYGCIFWCQLWFQATSGSMLTLWLQNVVWAFESYWYRLRFI